MKGPSVVNICLLCTSHAVRFIFVSFPYQHQRTVRWTFCKLARHGRKHIHYLDPAVHWMAFDDPLFCTPPLYQEEHVGFLTQSMPWVHYPPRTDSGGQGLYDAVLADCHPAVGRVVLNGVRDNRRVFVIISSQCVRTPPLQNCVLRMSWPMHSTGKLLFIHTFLNIGFTKFRLCPPSFFACSVPLLSSFRYRFLQSTL